jgi:cytochrome c peroxidase
MDIRIAEVVDRLADDSYLQTLSQTAYGRPISEYSIILGLATFVKSLVSVDSRYDAYINGSATFTQEEKNGLALFNQHCASCHPAPYFGSNDIANNGTKTDYQHDLGRMRVTGDPSDEGKFRIPSLRNITLTYPYMHDGSFETIYAVLEHYNTGGTNHHNQDESVKPLNLSKGDLDALSAFLHTLTDNSIATNPALANPW